MILEAALIASLATDCAPNVDVSTMQALILQESSGNPYSIGVVGSPLVSQPTSKKEAIEAAGLLLESGANISLGLGQINYQNLKGLDMTIDDAFEFCPNIKAADKILSDCFKRAENSGLEDQDALKGALSCYYSNNFTTGLKREKAYNNTSYVDRIGEAHKRMVPAISYNNTKSGESDKNRQKAIGENATTNHNGWDVFKDF